MASTAIQEVLHMTSPIFTSQPLHFPLPLTDTSCSSKYLLSAWFENKHDDQLSDTRTISA